MSTNFSSEETSGRWICWSSADLQCVRCSDNQSYSGLNMADGWRYKGFSLTGWKHEILTEALSTPTLMNWDYCLVIRNTRLFLLVIPLTLGWGPSGEHCQDQRVLSDLLARKKKVPVDQNVFMEKRELVSLCSCCICWCTLKWKVCRIIVKIHNNHSLCALQTGSSC